MSVHKDKANKKWFVKIKYVDWTGKQRSTTRRGFNRKSDAQDYEANFLLKHSGSATMTFQSLYELYMQDCKHRLRPTTYSGKVFLFESKIIPYFGKSSTNEITPAQIRHWQNKLMTQGYTETYLKTINNQLSAIFNFAVKYYNLSNNPARRAGSMGKSHADAMKFWTLDEFTTFIQHTTSLLYKTIFTLLFWSGIREGELLALNYNDFDFEKKLVHINKSYTRLKKEDLIGPTKTAGSRRDVTLPEHVLNLVKEFAASVYELDSTTRLFEVTKHGLRHEMYRVGKNFDIKQIRVHDLRHSHASYLIERGVPILAVSKRLGHDKIETTLRTYAHLYPKKQDAIVSLMETDINKAILKSKI